MDGIEPSLPKEPDFESGASTNSTTSAIFLLYFFTDNKNDLFVSEGDPALG